MPGGARRAGMSGVGAKRDPGIGRLQVTIEGGVMRRTVLMLVVAMALVGAFGCTAAKEKVQAAENPAPAGEYLDIDVTSQVRVNERANFAWEVDGAAYDAIADESTTYYVEGSVADIEEFFDAAGGWGDWEEINTIDGDDTFDMLVEPAGVITDINVNIGE